MEYEYYTACNCIEHLHFHRVTDYDDIVYMNIESRYELLTLILTEKKRGIYKDTKASYKEYAEE